MPLNFLKKYDLYIKPHKDFQIQTTYGGLVTLLSIILIISLFTMELLVFLTPEILSDMRVDTSRLGQLPINLDITFPKAPCDALSFSYLDVAGRSQVNLEHTMMKQALDHEGNAIDEVSHKIVIDVMPEPQKSNSTEPQTEEFKECGSCYGAETMNIPCCNTCNDVERAYRRKGWTSLEKEKVAQCVKENPDILNTWGAKVKKSLESKEGCRIHGNITVNRVAGSLYIAPGGTTLQEHGAMVHKYPGMEGQTIYDFIYNLDHTHKIDEFHFGEDKLPNQENPLEGINTFENTVKYNSIRHTYFLKIVPSTFEYLLLKNVANNKRNIKNAAQYSMTQHVQSVEAMSRLPGIWFDFQISPMLVRYKEVSRSFTHFITSLVAIIGGIFAVAGLIDSTLYRSLKHWQKQQLGKD